MQTQFQNKKNRKGRVYTFNFKIGSNYLNWLIFFFYSVDHRKNLEQQQASQPHNTGFFQTFRGFFQKVFLLKIRFQENFEEYLGFRRNNSKTVIHCKPNFTKEILCSETMKQTQNGFPNNPQTIRHSLTIRQTWR